MSTQKLVATCQRLLYDKTTVDACSSGIFLQTVRGENYFLACSLVGYLIILYPFLPPDDGFRDCRVIVCFAIM